MKKTGKFHGRLSQCKAGLLFLLILALAGCWNEPGVFEGSLGYPFTSIVIDPASCTCTSSISLAAPCEQIKGDAGLQLQSCTIAYAATNGAGLFKTTNGGTSWQVIPARGEMYIQSLAVDAHPKAPAPRVLYVGTEDGGVMQSYDGGMSWNFQISPILAVSKVIVDPKTDDLNPPGSCRVLNNEIPPCYTIFAASQGSGVWRSDNQGDTWKQITAPGLTETNVVSLALSPPKTTATMLYAGTEGGRVFKYVPDPTFPTDPTLGKWTEQTTSPVSTSFTPLLPRNPVSLAVHPGGTTFYAGLGGNKGGGGGGLWRSDDDGRHWDEVASILNVKPDSVYALNIIDLPNTTIYAGFSGLKRCLGSTACLDPAFWSNIAVPSDRGVSALAVDPYTQTLMITGNYIGELFRSADGGLTWTKIDIGN